MQINSKVLSIPPYISTSWKHVQSLHLETRSSLFMFVVTLTNGTRIDIPHLELAAVESAFEIHAQYLQKELATPQNAATATPVSFLLEMQKTGFKFPTQMPLGLDHFGSILEHNPEQAGLPDLPPELLKRVAALSKMIGIEDPSVLPHAEPDCNCLHCQIARALESGFSQHPKESEEEIVSDEDLKFRSWDINQTHDKLYIVANPLDAQEQYSVYLGEPVGCTCGQKHCEHIEAVLNS